MGWNEARVWLVPDGWDLVVEEIDIQTASGETGRLVSTKKSLDCTADALDPGVIDRWLTSRGFSETEKRKSPRTYRRDDVRIDVCTECEEVRDLLLEFKLTRRSPGRWPAWRQLVAEICDSWPVALADWESQMKVGPEALSPFSGGR